MEHQATVITFGPFRLVTDKRELWKDEALLKVRSMPLAVLAYFAQHPERVIPGRGIAQSCLGRYTGGPRSGPGLRAGDSPGVRR